MAWAVQNGMKPYVDVINMNFPGPIIIHLIARLISGSSEFGLRLLDSVFIFILCFSSSILMKCFKISWVCRILALTVYLVNYYSTPFAQTAQRESFVVPLIVTGLLPFVIDLFDKEIILKDKHWFVFGVITAMGLWIKPTLLLLNIFIVIYYCLNVSDKRKIAENFRAYVLGFITVSLIYLIWLYYAGGLIGFFKWSIKYAILSGEYTFCNQPWPTRFKQSSEWLNGFPLPTFLLLFGTILVIISNKFTKLLNPQNKQFYFLLGSGIVIWISILIQGKTHCLFHFIPLQWLISVLSAYIINYSDFSTFLKKRKKIILFICLLFIYQKNGEFTSHFLPPETTQGKTLAKRLQANLSSSNKVVTFGFFPTFLSNLERKTSFPFIDSRIVYDCSSPGSYIKSEIADKLYEGLKDPQVKYFISEQGRIQQLEEKNNNIKEILSSTYHYSYSGGGLLIYEHN